MSLCDKCFHPGACCKGFILSGTFWLDGGNEGVIEDLARRRDLSGRPFPFIPLHPAPDRSVMYDEPGRAYAQWIFNCPKLGADGRCTIYEDRPDTCRVFEPLSDRLCVHWRGAEGGEGAYPFPVYVKDWEARSDVDQLKEEEDNGSGLNDNSADTQGTDAGP